MFSLARRGARKPLVMVKMSDASQYILRF
uniref:Uncharacterized protein n=1 Tax=Arundo donax TaxID=35708 RepID=A0A0A9BZY2_ARUDO